MLSGDKELVLFKQSIELLQVPDYPNSMNVALKINYCIAGNFRGRKHSQIGRFSEENLCGLYHWCCSQKHHTPQFCRENLHE